MTDTSFVKFPLYVFDRAGMNVFEVMVTKTTDNRIYLEKPIVVGGMTVSRGDRGGSSWLHSPLTPEGNVFDTGPTVAGVKSDKWVVAYGKDKNKLLAEISTRQTEEVARMEKQLKMDRMWLAGFKATFSS